MGLTREAILQADDLDFEEIEVKKWGGKVRVCTMTAAERDLWEDSIVGEDGKPKPETKKAFRAILLVRCLRDTDGNLLFTAKDAPELAKKSAKVVNELYEKARLLNGIGKQAEEELEKNSETGQENGSSSS